MIVIRNAVVLWALVVQFGAQHALRPLLNFAGTDTSQKWQAVNDGVMGGVSEGRFTITADSTFECSGRLSLVGLVDMLGLRRHERLAAHRFRGARCVGLARPAAFHWILGEVPVEAIGPIGAVAEADGLVFLLVRGDDPFRPATARAETTAGEVLPEEARERSGKGGGAGPRFSAEPQPAAEAGHQPPAVPFMTIPDPFAEFEREALHG